MWKYLALWFLKLLVHQSNNQTSGLVGQFSPVCPIPIGDCMISRIHGCWPQISVILRICSKAFSDERESGRNGLHLHAHYFQFVRVSGICTGTQPRWSIRVLPECFPVSSSANLEKMGTNTWLVGFCYFSQMWLSCRGLLQFSIFAANDITIAGWQWWNPGDHWVHSYRLNRSGDKPSIIIYMSKESRD